MESNDQSNLDLSDQFFAFDGWLEGDDPALAAPEYLQDPPHVPIELDAPPRTGDHHEEPNSSKQ